MTKVEHERLSGITYEQELEILAEVYRLALESYRKRKQEAAGLSREPGSRDDVRKGQDAHTATEDFTR